MFAQMMRSMFEHALVFLDIIYHIYIQQDLQLVIVMEMVSGLQSMLPVVYQEYFKK